MKKCLIKILIFGVALSLFMDSEVTYGADEKGKSKNSDAKVTFERGKLELNSVPVLDFGNETISSERKEYTLNDLQSSLQITDERGSGEGWSVTVQASQFKNGSESSLPGATLKFGKGVASNVSNNSLPAPEIHEITLETDTNSQKIVTASPKEEGQDHLSAQGLGEWVINWFDTQVAASSSNVVLEVPAGVASEGEHTATITWTLHNGPDGSTN